MVVGDLTLFLLPPQLLIRVSHGNEKNAGITENQTMRPGGFEPPTYGLGNI